MGVLTALILAMAMMFSLGKYKETDAATRTKLSETIQAEFALDTVGTRVRIDRIPTALEVFYTTRADSKFDTSAQNAEMQKIAEFAVSRYEGKDLRFIDEIRVTRSETHGSGCFQQTYVGQLSVPNPLRGLRSGIIPVPDAPVQDPPPEK